MYQIFTLAQINLTTLVEMRFLKEKGHHLEAMLLVRQEIRSYKVLQWA